MCDRVFRRQQNLYTRAYLEQCCAQVDWFAANVDVSMRIVEAKYDEISARDSHTRALTIVDI